MPRPDLRTQPLGAPVILMYHQIAERAEDPWGLAVSPSHFAEQMEVLRHSRRVVALGELVDRLAAGRPLDNLAVVTFDDGYADNFTVATPVLERLAIPATVFVVGAAIGSADEFWWDELGRILLEPGHMPATLCAEIAGGRREWPLGAARDYSPAQAAAHRFWRAWQPAPTERHAIYVALWRLLRQEGASERERILAQLRHSAAVSTGARPDRRKLTPDELAELGSGGLIEIGGHSLSHAALPEQPAECCAREVREGKRAIESVLGRAVSAFAYPFGDHDDASIAAVREAGFACAVTTVAKPVGPQCDPFRLPRVGVEDLDAAAFARRLA